MKLQLAGDQPPEMFVRVQFQDQSCSICLSVIWLQGVNHDDSADDPRLGGGFVSLERQEALQRDLDRLMLWAMIIGMKFQKFKFNCLSFETNLRDDSLQ